MTPQAPPLTPRQQRRIEKTRAEVRAAARAVLERKSYAQVTLRDITDEADITHPTFYKHFASKEDVLGDLIDLVISELIATGGAFGFALVDPDSEGPTRLRERMRRGMRELLDVVRANRKLLLAVRQAITANEAHAQRWSQFRSGALVVLRRDLSWARERGIVQCEDIDVLASAVIASAEAAIFEFAERDDCDMAAVEDVLGSFYWNALFGWRGGLVDYIVTPDDTIEPVYEP